MVLTFYDSLVLLTNYNILILYDYRYYYDFKIVFNLLILYIYNGGVRIRNPCPNTDTLGYILYLYTLDKIYIIDESIRQITITLFIINFMNNVF